MLRTVSELLREALPADVAAGITLEGVTLDELACELKSNGRASLLSRLKQAGVARVGDRQKLANMLSKAERSGSLRPYLDETAAVASGLAAGAVLRHRSAQTPSQHLENATALKEQGNTCFKSSQHKSAIDFYADAIWQAEQYVGRLGSSSTSNELLASLHSNTAASFLKLERWADAVTSATGALDVDAANAKALYRRGIAFSRLQQRQEASKDLFQCAKLDPKNREAREALAALDAEKAAQKAAFREAFKEKIARDDAADETATSAATAAAEAEAQQYYARAAREAARRDGVDLEVIDKLHETLRSEGVDVTDATELNAALLARGASSDVIHDRRELEEFARDFTAANPVYGVNWGAGGGKGAGVREDEDDGGEIEVISTDSMYKMSSWGTK